MILSGGAGVGKTKAATDSAVEIFLKYGRKSILCALTFPAAKSLAIHMVTELVKITSHFKQDYKFEMLLMEEFSNMIKLIK